MTRPPSSPAAAPGAVAWVVWIVAVAAYTVAVANRTSLSAVGVDAAERFHTDAATLAMFAVVQLAVYGGVQIPVGILLDRFGARPVMASGMLLMTVGQLTMAFSESVPIALLARTLLGAGDAAIFPGAIRLVATWFPAQRGPFMGQMTGIIGQLGQIVAIVPLAALMHSTTWSITFGSMAALALLFTILVVLLIRNRPAELTQDVTINTETGAIRTVTSAVDTRSGIRATLAHPGTRLAFWSHFTSPFSGTAFVVLWGMPYLTAGEGRNTAEAAAILSIFVFGGMIFAPILGALSARFPMQRSMGLVVPSILVQLVLWLCVILFPGPAPVWLLVLLVSALATGGPASMIAFDHARAHNPAHRLSTATGVTNGGGFIAALLAILLIGVALDMQGASTPDRYSLSTFRLAMATQIPVWLFGLAMIMIERRKTRARMGL